MLKKFNKNLSEVLNTFENIMENGAFALLFLKILWQMEHLLQKSKCSSFHNIFKCMIFQWHLKKALSMGKGLRAFLQFQWLNFCKKTAVDYFQKSSFLLPYEILRPTAKVSANSLKYLKTVGKSLQFLEFYTALPI